MSEENSTNSENQTDTNQTPQEKVVQPSENGVKDETANVESERETVRESGEDAEAQPATKLKPTHLVVLNLMLVLLVGAIAVIFIIPPGGTQPVSTNSSAQFEMFQKTTLRSAGQAAESALLYAKIDKEIRYQLFVQEENQYKQGELIKTEFRARVVLSPGSSKTAGSIYVSLEDVHVSVKDGATEKPLSGLGEMLEGITFEGVLDETGGLGRLIPRSKINPQVARVLYIVTDLLRYAFLPLPKESVGVGANWQNVLKIDKNDKVSVIADTIKKENSEYQIDMRTMSDNVQVGKGAGILEFEQGVVKALKGTLKSTLLTESEARAEHTVVFGLTKAD